MPFETGSYDGSLGSSSAGGQTLFLKACPDPALSGYDSHLSHSTRDWQNGVLKTLHPIWRRVTADLKKPRPTFVGLGSKESNLVRPLEEEAAVGRNRRVLAEQVLEHGDVGAVRV